MKRISLTQGQYAIIDDEDYEFLVQWKWHVVGRDTPVFYAARGSLVSDRLIKRKMIYMHRVLCPGDHENVDHIDHNGINNQKHNLRGCTHRQNLQNQRCKRGVSQYKGVSRGSNQWRAAIKSGSKIKHLGYFNKEIDAAKAYNEAAKEMFGKFACLNNI